MWGGMESVVGRLGEGKRTVKDIVSFLTERAGMNILLQFHTPHMPLLKAFNLTINYPKHSNVPSKSLSTSNTVYIANKCCKEMKMECDEIDRLTQSRMTVKMPKKT